MNLIFPPVAVGDSRPIGVDVQPQMVGAVAGQAPPTVISATFSFFPSGGAQPAPAACTLAQTEDGYTRVSTPTQSFPSAQASGTVTVAGTSTTGQTNTITINGTTINVAQATGNTPAQDATALANAINANGAINTLVRAAAVGAVATITAAEAGFGGNGVSLAASSTGGGTLTASGATLAGGAGAGQYVCRFAITWSDGTVDHTVNALIEALAVPA